MGVSGVSEGVKSHAVIGLYTSGRAREGAPAANQALDAEFASRPPSTQVKDLPGLGPNSLKLIDRY